MGWLCFDHSKGHLPFSCSLGWVASLYINQTEKDNYGSEILQILKTSPTNMERLTFANYVSLIQVTFPH